MIRRIKNCLQGAVKVDVGDLKKNEILKTVINFCLTENSQSNFEDGCFFKHFCFSSSVTMNLDNFRHN